jgi:transketolase
MRNTFSKTLYECALADPSIYIVVADISPAGPMAEFQKHAPERFINVGVAEQVMIGMCAGLALKGCQPFAYTIATFSLYRPFEMVRDDLGYQNLPVTVVGMGAGVIYSTLGGTHHTMEDVAVASAIPNFRVLAPCDPLECIEATRWCAKQREGPVYLRIGKAGEPNLTAGAEPFVFGKLRYLQRGEDVCILSYGVITAKALDRAGIIEVFRRHQQVIVIEEHVPEGGLASRVKQIAWDIKADSDLHTFTLQDEFIHNYGSHDDLLAAHGIAVPKILAAVS